MTDNRINKLLDSWIDKNRNEILEKWMELARVPSIKSAPSDNAPYGENCAKALELSAKFFSDEGFRTEVDRKGGYALSYYGENGSKIGLFSHSDVVPVGEDWLYTEPFNPIIKDGALIGRGVEDNKSGIMHAYCVYKFFKDNEIKLNNTLQTFIGSDEECGMEDMDAYLEKHSIPEISIVPDADFPCSVGEKGIYHFWAESKRAFDSIEAFFGGEAFNIVLDRATVQLKFSAALESEISKLIDGHEEFTLCSGGEMITLSAKGIAKHASIPEGAVNAALLIAELLSACGELSDNDREIFTLIKSILGSFYGGGIGCVHTDDKFGRLTSVNGIVKLENGRPCLSFDVRYGSTLSADVLEEKSEKTLSEVGFTVNKVENKAGFAIDDDSKMPGIFEDIYAEITGERLERVIMAGGTYARRLKNAFSVGTYAFKKGEKEKSFKMPDGHGGAHQCDEMIDINAFFTALKIIVNYILACDRELCE
ncbi:MAG: Sapep family Mn(2+)-dependent dipeptidase [Clostridia bacterium]|nr:Sapep family Mn(2+)-dependent dipeptidase [Clostridia bacterium]